MLKIDNLKSRIGDTEILRGLSLSVNAGEVHAIMGPNGSGKSTLAQVVAGHQDYEVTGGTVTFKGQDLLELEPEERAREAHIPWLPVPGRNSGCEQCLSSQGSAQCQAQACGTR